MSIDDQEERVTIRTSAGLYSLDRTTVLSWLTSSWGWVSLFPISEMAEGLMGSEWPLVGIEAIKELKVSV
jgi:hypothetical protein